MVSKLKDTKYTTINDNNNKKLRIRLGIQNATNIFFRRLPIYTSI
jgi:hypothetical protein